ncbi:MAG: hypothetical protein AB7E55_14490 [Pigmentiphaga sp.]
MVFGDRHPALIPRLDGEAVAPSILMAADGGPPDSAALTMFDEGMLPPDISWGAQP